MSHTESASYPVIPSTEDVSSTAQSAANSFANGASNAYNTAANHPATQNVKNTFSRGPVAVNVKDQASKTSDELAALSRTRQTPTTRTATGQNLTQYHSFFGSLFSWENPRASAVAYASTVAFIFAARYLDLLRYSLKLTWMVLGITVAAEVAGRALFNSGFTAQIRPRRYYTLPKETLDSMTGDLDELINFFVIESQRLLFAENVLASGAALVSAFISYYLVKIVPLWGLALIGTSVAFLVPLIYKTNQALIDSQIEQISQIVNAQTNQVKQMASQHASAAAATTKMYVGDYSAKAQEMIGRARSSSPVARKSPVSAAAAASPSSPSASKGSVSATHVFPPPTEAALKTEGLGGAAAAAEAELRMEDFPEAPKKVVSVGDDGLVKDSVPSVGNAAMGLREEESLLG